MLHILILCTHNSARSILAEGMLNHHARLLGRDIQAHSAGSAPSGCVNPRALEALANAGVSTDFMHSKSWDVFTHRDAPPLSIVITVCDAAAAEACPVFFAPSGQAAPLKLHWGYPDPSSVDGDDETKRDAFESTCRSIERRIQQLLTLPLESMDQAARLQALTGLGAP